MRGAFSVVLLFCVAASAPPAVFAIIIIGTIIASITEVMEKGSPTKRTL